MNHNLQNHRDSGARGLRAGRGRAFTIIELLVVIIIVVVLIGISIPAFRSLIESSERSLAENQLRVGLAAARDAAIQSTGGDAAAVFFFSPGGKVSIVPCVSVGTMDDAACVEGSPASIDQAATVRREVFVPLPSGRPLQMPRNWSVRGFTPANTVSTTTDPNDSTAHGWYDSLSAGTASDDAAATRHWVFPETGFLDLSQNDIGDQGWRRQTFIVRFKAGTGVLDTGNLATVLIFDPVAVPHGTGFRSGGRDPWGLPKTDPANRPFLAGEAAEPARFVARLTARSPASDAERDQIIRTIGDRSIDTILARPVSELALYNEKALAGALAQSLRGRGLNRLTNTVYEDPVSTGRSGPVIDLTLYDAGVTSDLVNEVIGKWIEGRATVGNVAPTGTNGIESDARIFTLQHYLGNVQELQQ